MSDKPFLPSRLPLDRIDWERLVPSISAASISVARFDGAMEGIINAAVLLSPITNQEAVLSSRIEGTQASLTEVLKHEAGEEVSDEKRGDIKEIMNYRRALLLAEGALVDRPVTLQLVRQLHEILMSDVRGGDQTPGEFRTTQNWIGVRGEPIEKARFVPPSPLVMKDALENFEAYICKIDKSPLVQLAVAHAQFEIIHPFNDGNGRLGRMLVPLLMHQYGVLQRPTFYLSEYLEAHEGEYRDRLLAITNNGEWTDWIEFFLRAVDDQAQSNMSKARHIHDLYEEMKPRFREATHSQFSLNAVDAFFQRPIMNTIDFGRISGIENRGTANTILRALSNQGLVHVVREGGGRRPAIYALHDLINITEGRPVLGS